MDRISVMIVDDSALMRNLLSKIVSQTDDLEVCATAMNGRFALEKLTRFKPDVMVLDLEMPDVNGIDFLTERRKRGITVPVIILSSLAQRGARITMDALSLGASDFLFKPTGKGGPELESVAAQLVQMLRAYGGEYRATREGGAPTSAGERGAAKTGTGRARDRSEGTGERGEASQDRSGAQAQKPANRVEEPAEEPEGAIEAPRLPPKMADPARGMPKRTPARAPGAVKVIAMGISTGGPNALRKLLPALREDLHVPILIVQHMPASFTTEFAASLNRISSQDVREARDGDIIREGRVYIAPGDRHMRVEKRSQAKIIRIGEDDLINGHRPSADALFASVATAYGHECLAAIMTGMGRDGAREIGSIYEAGGRTIGQDEKSSVVYGMPRAAFEAGYLHEQLSLEAIAEYVNSVTAEAEAGA